MSIIGILWSAQGRQPRRQDEPSRSARLPAVRVRLVATDLDGTLLRDDRSVGRRTVAALGACAAAGVAVVPITARPPHATWPLLQAASLAGADGLVVCANG